MKAKKILSIILSAAMMAGILAGCGGDTSSTGGNTTPTTPTTPPSSEEQNQPQGDSVKDSEQYVNTYVTADPTSFDSSQATDTIAINMLINMMEPLVRYEEQEDGTVVPVGAGAETWEISEDGLVWTFHLRDNNWSDGEPVKAQDYAYGITRVVDPAVGAPYSYILMPIKNAYAVNNGEVPVEELGVKAIDDKTLEVTLEAPTSYFMGLVCHTTMMPQRQDIVEKFGDQYGTEIDKLVFNGPFKGQSWVHNNEVVLVKNDQYWDKDSVSLETINYKIIQDENAIYSSLENGSIDTASTLTNEWTQNFMQNPQLVHKKVGTANVYYQYYNQNDPLFANANVRKAFTLAIDREELNNVIYDGLREPAYSMVPTEVMVGDVEYASVSSQPIKKLQSESGDAKELLIKGLEELNMDTDPSKLSVELQLGGTDQWTKTLAEYMQQTYKKVLGVELKINMLDWGVFMTNFYAGDYQIGQMSFGAEFNDPLSMMSSMDSSQDGYCIGWGDERVDELLLAASEESDTQKKIDMIEEMEDIFLVRDACVTPLTFATIDYFTYDYVKNMSYNPFYTAGYKYTYTSGR